MRWFDILSTCELEKRAKAEGLDPNGAPEIHYIHPDGELSVVDRKFYSAVNSHCVEHQPDLMKHLNQIEVLLQYEESRYWVIIPDKRYCFEAPLPVSSLSEIVQANVENHVKPSIWKVIEHWRGNSGERGGDLRERWKAAEVKSNLANGKYINVHCWQFIPESFALLVGNLHNLKLTNFQVEQIFQTPTDNLEFSAVLRKFSVKF